MPDPGRGTPRQPALVRAAEYVRMSTEGQTCSPQVQRDVIQQYAAERGIHIVRRYADEGKSGLTLEGRPGLKGLIAEITEARNDFNVLLVYDVSRWGRFQDTDESAYYEFLCRRAGVLVIYCAEPFENDHSTYSNVVKSLKRIMAAEYSRELSKKIFLSQSRHARRGFHQGGNAGFALRRVLIDGSGKTRRPLEPGEQKGLRTDRTVLAPGAPEEVATVKKIFRLYVDAEFTTVEIARKLNNDRDPACGNQPWAPSSVRRVLRNERYAGAIVYNRHSRKLASRSRTNPRADWVRSPGALEAIVPPEIFDRAQDKLGARSDHRTDDELLDALRRIWQREGSLTRPLIDAAPGIAWGCTYIRRFGSMRRAYPTASTNLVNSPGSTLRPIRRALQMSLLAGLFEAGVAAAARRESGVVDAAGITVSVYVAPCERRSGRPFWRVDFGRSTPIRIGVLARLGESGGLMDCFVVSNEMLGLTKRRILPPDAGEFAPFAVGFLEMPTRVTLEIERLVTATG